MKANRNRLYSRRGFTLAEMLIVIVIVAALAAIGAASYVGMQRNMQQAKLDRMAENLYTAAQNQLTLRAARGKSAEGGTPVASVPEELNLAGGRTLRYAASFGPQDVANMIFPQGSISDDLRSGSWIVEYEPKSYSVYSVFYWEGTSSDTKLSDYYVSGSNDVLAALRGSAEQRGRASHYTVGYYSGNIAELSERNVGELKCRLEIENGEELTAAVLVSLPAGEGWTDPTDFGGETLRLALQITGRTSGAVKNIETEHLISWDEVSTVRKDLLFNEFRFVLDSLKDGGGFSEQFSGFIPGEDITLEAVVSCTNTKIALSPAADWKTTNSLFADGSTSGSAKVGDGSAMIVRIGCGRHLQNLDKATSGFEPGRFSTGTVAAAVQIEDIAFGEGSAWANAYENKHNTGKQRDFTPITNGEVVSYNGNGKTITDLTVNSTGSAGLFARFEGSDLSKITLVDCTFSASTGLNAATGGLAGMTTKPVTVSDCRLYMSGLITGTDSASASSVNWMVAENGPAGGLIGAAADALTIVRSFAATVIRGKGIEGGLVGKADGVLKVNGSYADCYLSAKSGASRIGGLAGGCGAGSSFTNSYSAGFVIPGTGPVTAAGFVPASADVSDSYSVFCFDDATKAEQTGIGDKQEYVPAKISGMTRYALTSGGTYSRAYYTYGDVTATSAQLVSAEDLAKNAGLLTGFAGGMDAQHTHLYRLTDKMLSLSKSYPYPTISGLDHYNDFFAVTTQPVKIIGVVLSGVSENPKCDVETRSVSANMNGNVVDTGVDQRIAANQVFVGWVDEDGLNALKSMSDTNRVALCEQLDALDIKNGRLVSGLPDLFTDTSKGALAEVKDDSGTVIGVTASSRVKETKRIYAVYREVMPYDVVIRFMSFNPDLFAEGTERDENDAPTAMNFDVTVDKYLGSGCFAVRQEIVYTINKLRFSDYKTAKKGPYDLIREVEYKGEPKEDNSNATGYTVISQDYLAARYPNIKGTESFVPIACFKPTKATETMKLLEIDPSDWTVTSGRKELSIQLDQPRIYSVLCSTKMIDVPVRFVFLDSAKGDGKTFEEEFSLQSYPKLEDRLQAAKNALKTAYYVAPTETEGSKTFDLNATAGYCITADEVKAGDGTVSTTVEYRKHTVYSLIVHMNIPPNAVIWSEIPKFDGFELMPDEIENKLITEASNQDGNAPIVPYKRIPYTLAFDIGEKSVCKWPETDNGNIRLDENSGVVVKKSSTIPDSISDMHAGQSTKGFLPMSEALCTGERTDAETAQLIERGFLYCPGHRLTGWKFYDLATYGPGAPELGEITLDKKGKATGDFSMPSQSVLAVAQWSELEDAPVRVEIYIQNVTDNWRWNLSTTDSLNIPHSHTYSYYNSYSVGTKKDTVKIAEYESAKEGGYSVYDALLRKAYKNCTMPEYAISDDIREYLRDATVKVSNNNNNGGKEMSNAVDGRIRNPQLVINEANSGIANGKIKYEIDAAGTAVFKLYYDRKINQFSFSYPERTTERAQKQSGDPGTTEGYEWIKIPYSSDGHYYFGYIGYNPYSWDSTYTDELYLLRNNLIDDYVKNGTVSTNADDYERASSASVLSVDNGWFESDDYYVFAKRVTDVSGGSDRVYYIPFYDQQDLKAAIYSGYRTISDGGLTKTSDKTVATSIRGLYEQPHSLAYAYQYPDAGTPWHWPGEGRYGWATSCAYTDGYGNYYTESLSGNLTYLSNFYFFKWINGNEKANPQVAKTTELSFKGSHTSGEVPVRFYLEKNGRDADLGSEGFKNLTPEFTYYSNSGSFTLNDKFDGYTVSAYRVNGGDWKTEIGTEPVDYTSSLDVYYARNEYQVIFRDVQGIGTQKYLYGQTLKSLPVIPEGEDDKYRPEGVDKEYLFRGWYTESNGGGHKLDQDGNGVFYVDENGENVYLEMPSSNLTIFAFWSPNEVEVKLYSRLPDVTDETQLLTDEEKKDKQVYSAYVTLYDIIPQSVFGNLMDRWAGYSDGIYRSEYRFDGWFRSGAGVPGHDEILASRFYEEKEHVTKPFSLAAQWSKIYGSAPYNIRCYLIDHVGNVRTIELPGGFATIGEPLNVSAPGASRDERLNGYYPLKSITSIEKFSPSTYVEFSYMEADTWSYEVCYELLYKKTDGTTIAAAMKLDEPGDIRQSSAENVYVWPRNIVGYRLEPETQEQQVLEKPDDQKTVLRTKPFTCVLDPESFSVKNLEWTQGGSVPGGELWSVENETGNALPCPEGYAIRTYYVVGSERFDSLETLLKSRKAGSNTVNVFVELWKTGESDTYALTIYSGTATVTVYSRITLGDYGALLFDGSSFTSPLDGKTAEEIIASAVSGAQAAGTEDDSFKGFFAGGVRVINADGTFVQTLPGQLWSNIDLTAEYN